MFDDIQVIEQVIEGTYKKLKSYYYYDKTLLHIKNKIVDFETRNSFTDRMKKLCKNLYEENQEYFEELINDIDMVIMPKSLKKVDAETKVIKGNIENNKKISKLNFSIDAPVELFIIDMLWMLIVKKLYLQKYGEFEYSYAGKLKKGIMKKDTDIINGIDFVSNRCFEPYFRCYTKWRNKALDVAKEYCKSENILMISLDLKNYYAPEERMDLAALGYTCKNPDKAIYYLIGNGFETFSTILCFEFTDIASRCIMKGKLDFLCVPQLNRDTNYFSSIVEATARDLHTLVVQANTSKYGDSRITGPYKTDFKDILKIKGGENEILIVGKLELKQLQNFRSDYSSKFEKQIDKCLKCKKVYSVHQLLTKCPRCKDKKENIKGLPPNWM